MLSIFASPAEAKAWAKRVNVGRPKHQRVGTPRRPLKGKTLDRIAGGLDKWVLKAKRPFIVQLAHGGDGSWAESRATSPSQPLGTIHAGGNNHAVVDATVAPILTEVGNANGHGGYSRRVDVPNATQTSKAKDLLVGATLAPYSNPRYGERDGQPPRSGSIDCPMATITGTGNQATLVAAMVTKHYGNPGYAERPGKPVDVPLDTITATDHNAISVAYLSHFYTSNTAGGHGDPAYPAKCITSGGQHAAVCVAAVKAVDDDLERERGQATGDALEVADVGETLGNEVRPCVGHEERGADRVEGGRVDPEIREQVAAPFTIGAGGPVYAGKPKSVDAPFGTIMVDDRRAIVAAFLAAYYGEGSGKVGHSLDQPMPTVGSLARFGLVTVVIDEITYVVTDIAMRMLTPRELLLAQGFDADYVIDRTSDGQHVTKADQVRLIGNSVPPPFARALVAANVVDQGVLGAPPSRKAVARA